VEANKVQIVSKDFTFNKRGMYRIFRDDGRSLIVAMDHGCGLNVYPALARPTDVLDAVVAGGADAVLTTPGIVKQFSQDLKSLAVILRLDGGSSQLAEVESVECNLLYSVEDALRLSADAVACMGFPGTALEAQTLGNVAKLAAQCDAWGIPLMAEMLPGGLVNSKLRTVENIRLAARIGVELGADFIKTEYVESPEGFQQVTENCYRPVLILGGAKRDDERGLFSRVSSSLKMGAAGVVMGRNVWGHARPKAMVKALCAMIHNNASVDEAMALLAGATD
jgi:DhnA family fructose-bisphosphate aldolase class Ia